MSCCKPGWAGKCRCSDFQFTVTRIIEQLAQAVLSDRQAQAILKLSRPEQRKSNLRTRKVGGRSGKAGEEDKDRKERSGTGRRQGESV